jgi:ELWxxDGT repeat protein
MKKTFYALSLCLFFSSQLYSQVTRVKDLNPGTEDGFDQWNYEGVMLNGKYLVPAKNATTGLELYSIENNDLVLVKDIYAGATASEPEFLTAFKGKVYFVATSEANGKEIWSTDGTAAGTQLAVEVTAGSGSTSVDNLVVGKNNKLYFSASGYVYVSDGTTAGTTRIGDLDGVDFEDDFSSASVTVTPYKNGIAYYNKDNKAFDFYYHDGTTNTKLATFNGGYFTTIYGLSEVAAGLLFAVYDSFDDELGGLYVVSGTNNQISEITAGSTSYDPWKVVGFGQKAIFKATPDGIYATDGTAAGTVKIAAGNYMMTQGEKIPHAVIGNKLVFYGEEKSFSNLVFVTDGTVAGTAKLGTIESSSYLSNMISSGTKAFVVAGVLNGFKPQFWMFDISNNSSLKLHAFTESSGSGESTFPLVVVNDKLYFNTNLKGDGRELYTLSNPAIYAAVSNAVDESSIQLVSSGTDLFKIKSENSSDRYMIEVFDLQGKVLKTGEISADESFELNGNTNVYLVNVRNEKSSTTFRVFLK